MTLALLNVHKADPMGTIQVSYDAWLVTARDPIALLARWTRPTLTTPYVSFARGDVLLELFPRHDYYNIFLLFDGDGLPPDADPACLVEPLVHSARQGEAPHRWPGAWRRLAGLSLPFKGHYANLTAPVHFDADSGLLVWQDMHLDMWVPVHGAPLLLDEEEYRALHLSQTEPDTYRALQQARGWLWAHALARSGPFRRPCT